MSDTEFKDAYSLAQDVEHFLNTHSNAEVDAFGEYLTIYLHRTLQQKAFRFMLSSIWNWSKKYSVKVFDKRNEETGKACKKITDLFEDKPNLPFI